jgi:hypothetical protein
MRHENTLTDLIREAFQKRLSLKTVFESHDATKVGVLPRRKFYRILESLPLGYDLQDIEEIFANTSLFDSYGNIDYTHITNSSLYSTLEKTEINKQMREKYTTTESEIIEIQENERVSIENPLIGETLFSKQAYNESMIISS